MPMYEYRCLNKPCGFAFDELGKIDGEYPKCPSCEHKTEKLMSSPAIRFKGKGFHGTDYTRVGPKR